MSNMFRLSSKMNQPLPPGLRRQEQPRQQSHCARKPLVGHLPPTPTATHIKAIVWPANWRHRWGCSATPSSASTTTTRSKLRVTLDTEEISRNVEFKVSELGERSRIILVSKVTAGSVAEQEGLKAGQQLLAISNPSQPEDLWNLNERASLRFVKDAVRLTRYDTVTVEVSGGAVDTSASRGADSQEKSGNEASLMDNIASSSQAGESQSSTSSSLLDSVEDMLEGGKDTGQQGQTLAQKLESVYKDEEDAAARERKQIESRKQRRRDYMERESTRDNTKLAVGLAAAFFLPAIGILTWAFTSGMMDRIGSSYRY